MPGDRRVDVIGIIDIDTALLSTGTWDVPITDLQLI